MALTQTQIDELNSAYNRAGGQTDVDKANIDYAMKTYGWTPPTTAETNSGGTSNASGNTNQKTDSTVYNRLPSGVTQEQYDTAKSSQYETKTPEQAAEDYRTSQMKAMQDRIDNINKVYADKLKSELEAQAPINANSLGRTNALSALMGLGGSSTSATRTAVTEANNAKINQGITDKVNAEKSAALEAIYGRIDEGAQKMYEAQLATNKANQKALLDDVATNALSNLQAMASTLSDTGKTFDDFKAADPSAFNSLMEQTGKSEYQLRQEWNNSIPENLRPTTYTSYKDDGQGGTIMSIVEFNPITKKATSTDYPINAPISTFQGEVKPIEGKNGELFVLQSDGTYKDVSPNAELTKQKLQADIANTKRLASGGGSGSSSADKSFQSDLETEITRLARGTSDWATSYDTLVGLYGRSDPELFQERTPEEIEAKGGNPDIDKSYMDILLNKAKYGI